MNVRVISTGQPSPATLAMVGRIVLNALARLEAKEAAPDGAEEAAPITADEAGLQ